ncbi:MAG: hypothetical protein LBH13_01710 [Cellulomonadaceae bacterium]|jgi:hypothetical protein|nr:hypothetical protein [Cellulomonadaceae bacterium]
MAVHEFTAYLDRQPTDEEIDALYEAGFDDSTIEYGNGRGSIGVFREGETIADAIESVVDDARRAGFTVVGIDDQDLVPLKTIAQRVGRSYEAVRRYATGDLGPGGFPPVVGMGGWTLVSWAAAAQWFRESLGLDLPDDYRGRVLTAANLLLRAHAMDIDDAWVALNRMVQPPTVRELADA